MCCGLGNHPDLQMEVNIQSTKLVLTDNCRRVGWLGIQPRNFIVVDPLAYTPAHPLISRTIGLRNHIQLWRPVYALDKPRFRRLSLLPERSGCDAVVKYPRNAQGVWNPITVFEIVKWRSLPRQAVEYDTHTFIIFHSFYFCKSKRPMSTPLGVWGK